MNNDQKYKCSRPREPTELMISHFVFRSPMAYRPIVIVAVRGVIFTITPLYNFVSSVTLLKLYAIQHSFQTIYTLHLQTQYSATLSLVYSC